MTLEDTRPFPWPGPGEEGRGKAASCSRDRSAPDPPPRLEEGGTGLPASGCRGVCPEATETSTVGSTALRGGCAPGKQREGRTGLSPRDPAAGPGIWGGGGAGRGPHRS